MRLGADNLRTGISASSRDWFFALGPTAASPARALPMATCMPLRAPLGELSETAVTGCDVDQREELCLDSVKKKRKKKMNKHKRRKRRKRDRMKTRK